MRKQKWPLSSDQIELLAAFSAADNLQQLADHLAKDISVVSRNLQRLAEDAQVIVKVKGRWQITKMGEEVVQLAGVFLADLSSALKPLVPGADRQIIQSHTALLVVNAQQGLVDKNGVVDQTKAQIRPLLDSWRMSGAPIIHVPHQSQNVESRFWVGSPGSAYISELTPKEFEIVIPKHKSSGFSETNLASTLTSLNVQTIILTGFTAGECIASTARDGSDLGFKVIVISDATCSFDLFGPKGELHKAEKIHSATLANLHNFFADIMTSTELKAAIR